MDEREPLPSESPAEELSWREQEVMALLAERLTNREIAGRLHLAESTVKEYVGNILGKLYVKNRRQAVERAKELGMLEPEGQAVFETSGNLPAPVTSFIGREAELAHIASLLDEPSIRLLTLTGPPGTGKTRLALQATADLMSSFHGGAFFVPLAPIREPDLLPNAIAKALAVKGLSGRPIEEALRAYLRSREMLLLLDNFEHVLAAAPLVGTLLAAAPGLKVLVTSREMLHLSGEHEFPVAPLELPDLSLLEPLAVLSKRESVSLFSQRSQAVVPDFQLAEDNAAVVAEICVRLEGLPLAIELAAARMKLFGPERLLELLEDRLIALRGGPLDLPRRQQTLRGTIDWSYGLLEEPEKKLFARLGVFLGGCTLEAAGEICSTDLPVDMLEAAESLFNKSLLLRDEGPLGDPRFRMLETLREYALERLEESGEAEALRGSHARYFLALAEQSAEELRGPDQSQWLDRLDPEHNNMRGALDWSLGGADPELGLRLVGAMGQYWFKRTHYIEGVSRTEQALALNPGAPAEFRGRALNSASWLCFYAGERLDEGKAWGEEALALFGELGYKDDVAWAHLSVGVHYVAAGDFNNLETHANRAHVLFRELDDKEGLATVFTALGEVARLRDRDYEQAEIFYQDSLSLSRTLDHRYYICANLYDLSDIARQQGEYERQHALLEESLSLAWKNRIRDFCAYALYGLAMAMNRQNQPERAARLFGAYQSFFDALGTSAQPHEAATIERDLAALDQELGEAAFEAAVAEGRAMTEEQAVAYALGQGGV